MSEHYDEERSNLNGSSCQKLSFGQWLCRFKHILIISAALLLQGCLVYSQLPFMKMTWFARQYAQGEKDLNCNRTPTKLACQEGAADMAYWSGILSGASGIAAIFSAIILGSLSDAIGRRIVIQASLAFSVCVSVTLLAVVLFDVSFWTYLVMETLEASIDSNGVWLAMIADLTQGQENQRGPIFGSGIVGIVLLACVFLPLSSLLTSSVAITVAAALSVACLCLALFMLPETSPVVSSPKGGLSALPSELHSAWSILNRHSFMQRMVAVLTLGGVAFAAKGTILRPYMMAHFGMDKRTFAAFLPVCAPSLGLSFTIGLWKAVPRFGEVSVLQGSFFANMLMTLGVVLASQTWQIFAIYGVFAGPGLMFIPLINAIKSNLCNDQEQGKIQGLVAAIRGFAVSFADVAFGTLYRWTTNGGKNTEGARSGLFLVFGLNLASAMLTLSLPATYPEPPIHESVPTCHEIELNSVNPSET